MNDHIWWFPQNRATHGYSIIWWFARNVSRIRFGGWLQNPAPPMETLWIMGYLPPINCRISQPSTETNGKLPPNFHPRWCRISQPSVGNLHFLRSPPDLPVPGAAWQGTQQRLLQGQDLPEGCEVQRLPGAAPWGAAQDLGLCLTHWNFPWEFPWRNGWNKWKSKIHGTFPGKKRCQIEKREALVLCFSSIFLRKFVAGNMLKLGEIIKQQCFCPMWYPKYTRLGKED